MNKKQLILPVCALMAHPYVHAQQGAGQESTDKRPNIILFLVDDMG